MPSSAVRTFSDPDEYAASIRQGTYDLTITERGQFAAKLVRIDLHRLWMQRFSENLSRVSHVAGWGGRAVFAFRTQSGPNLLRAGLVVRPGDIVRHSAGRGYFQHSSGFANYGSLSLPLEDVVSIGEAMGGFDLAPPADPTLVTAPPEAMARLQRLHAAAAHLAEQTPEIITNVDAANGLEQALIDATVACIAPSRQHEGRSLQGQHAIVMRRFRRMIEESPDQPLFIPEICQAIRVSERTLRACCQEHLAMSPKRYLQLRRLHLARRALRSAPAEQTTVTDIAMRYGFWQLGRFSVEYRALFGEAPSTTLRRPLE